MFSLFDIIPATMIEAGENQAQDEVEGLRDPYRRTRDALDAFAMVVSPNDEQRRERLKGDAAQYLDAIGESLGLITRPASTLQEAEAVAQLLTVFMTDVGLSNLGLDYKNVGIKFEAEITVRSVSPQVSNPDIQSANPTK